MKTKHFGLVAILVIMTLALIGCKKEEPDPCTCNPKDHLQAGETCTCGGEGCNCTEEQPHEQSETITLSFKKADATDTDPFLTATVQGYLTDTEWNGVAEKIKTAINNVFATRIDDVKARWKTLFSRGVTIIVEASPDGYTSWKTIGDGKTIYLSLDATEAEDLETLLRRAITGAIDNAIDMADIPEMHGETHGV